MIGDGRLLRVDAPAPAPPAAEPEGPGEGKVLALPVAPSPRGSNRSPVFLVDDSPLVRERLAALLSELPNVEVVGQADLAFEAIDSIRKLRPAAVVLDISMPGGSGLQVLEAIKRDRVGPMVIVLTNFANDHYRQKCLELGADYFFDKSTEFERVTEVLRPFPPAASAALEALRPAA
jgi:CheY-like chemotaxis protein